MDAGVLGGLLGSAVGVLGGAVGTWAGIRSTKGPRERAFVVRVSVVAWLGAGGMVAALLLLPSPWRYLAWIPWSILLAFGIVRLNRIQARLRMEEASGGPSPPAGGAGGDGGDP